MSTNGADIQLENGGYTRIHSALLDKLGTAPLSGSEFRCLMYLLRQTYGWQRKDYKLSMAQWAKAVNLDRRVVIRSVQRLLACHVIYRADNGPYKAATWGFNKYVEQWDFAATSDEIVTSDMDGSDTQDTTTSDNFVTSQGQTSDEIVTKTSDKNVTLLKKEKIAEVKTEESATAAQPLPPARDPWVSAYEEIWGMLVPSEYVAREIQEWEQRVTLEGWRYALRESLDANARNMRYLRRILERIERDGVPVKAQPQPTAQVNFTIEEVA